MYYLFLRASSSQHNVIEGKTAGLLSFTFRGQLEVQRPAGCQSLSWERAEVEMACGFGKSDRQTVVDHRPC